MKLCKLLLAAVGATALLGALVSTASARNLSISNQTLRSQFREVNFRLPIFTTRCQVTLEGSLHTRTIAKVQGALIGYITTARLGPCAAGSATILTETLPWHVRYLAFSGPLPNITDLVINVIGAAFRVREPLGVNCLSRSTAEEPSIGTFVRDPAAGGVLTTAEIGGTIRTGGECFNEPGTFTSDRGTVFVLGTTATRITVRLI
jgi:hypothetical protein